VYRGELSSVYRGELSSDLRIGEGIVFCCIFNHVDYEIFRRKMVLLMSGHIKVQFPGYYLCVVMAVIRNV
jgi:hypothetical protein